MVFPTFAAYAATFGKVYNGDEAATREAIYNTAIAEMTAHNADETQTYTQGVNQFTDLTPEEFQALPIRGLSAGKYSDLPKVGVHEIPEGEVAGDVNWVTKGAVTQSRTRASAARAGPSLPLVVLKAAGRWPLAL